MEPLHWIHKFVRIMLLPVSPVSQHKIIWKRNYFGLVWFGFMKKDNDPWKKRIMIEKWWLLRMHMNANN